MKVLYIGHYREGSGWSQAAIDYILSLDAAGVDVVCRPVKLNNARPTLPERILELEKRDLSDVTDVIQHVLPHYTDINTKFKNIAMFIGETDSFGISGWSNNLELFDEIWVPNTDLFNVAIKLSPTVRVIPHGTDITRFQKQYEPFDIPELKDKFVFYFIGEFNRRKHVSALLRAFHAEFDRNEDVALAIKVNKPGMGLEELQEFCRQHSAECKRALRKYTRPDYYHNEIFFCDYMTDDEIGQLHATGDCFVNPSFGEAWSIPTFDAMGYGNLVISSNVGGMKDFLKQGILVDGQFEHCFGADPAFSDLHTANENWFNISINDLQKKMRYAFEMKEERAVKCNWGKREALKYSHFEIGQQMRKALEDVE